MAENHLRVVSQAPAPQHEAYTPTADRIERLVSGFNESSYLPPKAELATAADEIETALIPAPEKMVEKAIAVMLAGYPSFRPEPLYIAGLVSDLGAYPLDVVIAVTNEIRRTQKFFPTHAEILTLAESLVQRRHKLRHQIGKAGRELERRDIEAEAAERDRQAERRRVMEIERRLVEHLGANAPPTGTYVRAEQFMRWSRPLGIMARFRLADEWEKALAVPEQWAVETTRRAAFVAEAIQAGLDAEALLEVLTAVSSNLDHARALLSAAISQPGGNIIRLLPRADWARELPDNIVAAISALVSRDRIEDAS